MKPLSVKKMTKLLAEKLTKEEFVRLFELMDEDPPAGPFWEAIAEHCEKIAPELFDSDDDIKKEIKRRSKI